jgi:two-component system nitrogen regulation response regulator GlnG
VIIPDFLPNKILSPQAGSTTSAAGDVAGTDMRQFVDERLEHGSINLYAEALEFMERYVVTRVLRVCEGNQSKAARMLGITRGCLRSKVRALKVSIDTHVQVEGETCEV